MNKIKGKVKMKVPYFQVPNKVFDVKNLDVYEKMTYIYLTRCANQGSTAFPSYDTIAKKCSMSRRKAIDAVNKLNDMKLIVKHQRKVEKDKNLSNIYEVIEPSNAHCALEGAGDALGDAHDAPNKELTDKELTNKYNNGHQQQINAKPVYYLQKVANDEIVSICEYYDKQYYSVNSKVLKLKPHQWINVRKVLSKYLDEQQLTVDDMKLVIDKYFADVDSNDYNILHFISGDIIKHRLVELGLAHYSEVK